VNGLFHPAGVPKTAVIGVGNEVTDKAWKDLRIGFGLKGMLTEAIYDTGFFHLVEEKPAIRERLGIQEKDIWEGRIDFSEGRLNEIAEALHADVIAYATIKSFKTPTSNTSVGVFSRTKFEARAEVTICIYDKDQGQSYCASGKGRTHHVADGLLVAFLDDGRLSTKSLIGKASKMAIDHALKKLLPDSQTRRES